MVHVWIWGTVPSLEHCAVGGRLSWDAILVLRTFYHLLYIYVYSKVESLIYYTYEFIYVGMYTICVFSSVSVQVNVRVPRVGFLGCECTLIGFGAPNSQYTRIRQY